MQWIHDEHPGRRVRLAYCLNLHAGDDLDALLAGIRKITLPLRDRLSTGRAFGVGMYLPAAVATEIAPPDAAGPTPALAALAGFLADEGLDPFTFNAFPYGGFHAKGLKESVYRPTWLDAERLEFTLAVARAAAYLVTRGDVTRGDVTRGDVTRGDVTRGDDSRHVSISTHPGSYGEWVRGEEDRAEIARRMADCVAALACIEREGGPRVVLSLEAEPRASANDTAECVEAVKRARGALPAALESSRAVVDPIALGERHLGLCLDCCHSAVEFEDAGAAYRLAEEAAIGKIQFSSALSLANPAADEAARRALALMDEPVYLHQVTGRRPAGGRLGCADLPKLAAALAEDAAEWLECDEWRCHFHVPVDLDALGGLGTTRAHADAILGAALTSPSNWKTPELHVEIETYTWDILPGPARGPGDLVDGLEREYRHTMALLESAGWHRA